MLTWLLENIGTILVLAVVLAVVGLVVAGMVRERRQGKSTCGGNCAHCGACSCCGKK